MNTPILIHLAELLAKSLLVLVPALILVALMRRCSAARRHTALLAAFVSLLLLPLGKFAVPHWRLSGLVAANPAAMQVLPVITVTGVLAPTSPAPAARPAGFSWPAPSRLMIGLWLAGAAILLGFRAFGSWQIARLKRNCTKPAGNRFSALAETVAREVGCATRLEVRFSDAARVPCTWGVRRAVVLLPAEAAQWSEAHLIAALRHEFAHVARRDYLTRWLSYTVCALYWPNPLVWFAARELYASQEQACDDLVLQAGTPSADYATLLFETARACTGAPTGWRNAIAMARPSTLENRVVAVVDETRDRRPAGRLAKLMGGIGVAGIVGASAMAQIAEVKPAAPVEGAAAAATQVMISAKFIEAPKGEFPAAQIAAGFEPPNWGNLLSAPRLTVNSGQRGMIQIGEERPLPPGSEPKTQFVGTSLEVLPVVADGKIQLRYAVEIVSYSLRIQAEGAGEGAATGQPIFTHRNSTANLVLTDGGKAVLPSIASDKPGREIFVILEAKILPPATGPASAGSLNGKEGDATRDRPIFGDFPSEGAPSEKKDGAPVVPPRTNGAGSEAKPAPVPQPSVPRAEPEAKPATAVAAAPGRWILPIEINAENTRVEGGVAIAEGNAKLKYGTTAIKSDSLRYNPDNHRAEFHGNVEIKTEGSTMRGENVNVEFGPDGRVSIGATTITARDATFDNKSRRAEFRGDVEIKTAAGPIRSDNANVTIEENGQVLVGKSAGKDSGANPSSPGAK